MNDIKSKNVINSLRFNKTFWNIFEAVCTQIRLCMIMLFSKYWKITFMLYWWHLILVLFLVIFLNTFLTNVLCLNNCLFISFSLIVCHSLYFFFSLTSFNICSFVFLSTHNILFIFLHIHIFITSKLSLSLFLIV